MLPMLRHRGHHPNHEFTKADWSAAAKARTFEAKHTPEEVNQLVDNAAELSQQALALTAGISIGKVRGILARHPERYEQAQRILATKCFTLVERALDIISDNLDSVPVVDSGDLRNISVSAAILTDKAMLLIGKGQAGVQVNVTVELEQISERRRAIEEALERKRNSIPVAVSVSDTECHPPAQIESGQHDDPSTPSRSPTLSPSPPPVAESADDASALGA